jgi:hypothetical protein
MSIQPEFGYIYNVRNTFNMDQRGFNFQGRTDLRFYTDEVFKGSYLGASFRLRSGNYDGQRTYFDDNFEQTETERYDIRRLNIGAYLQGGHQFLISNKVVIDLYLGFGVQRVRNMVNREPDFQRLTGEECGTRSSIFPIIADLFTVDYHRTNQKIYPSFISGIRFGFKL